MSGTSNKEGLLIPRIALDKLVAEPTIPCWWDTHGSLIFVRVAALVGNVSGQEEIGELRSLYFTSIFEAIVQHRGDVCLVMGEDVCGFVDGKANSDHSILAVRAAELIERRVKTMATRSASLRVTIGVHSGPVQFGVVGSSASCFRVVMFGAAVNVGSALAGPRVSADQMPAILISDAAAGEFLNKKALREVDGEKVLKCDLGFRIFTRN